MPAERYAKKQTAAARNIHTLAGPTPSRPRVSRWGCLARRSITVPKYSGDQQHKQGGGAAHRHHQYHDLDGRHRLFRPKPCPALTSVAARDDALRAGTVIVRDCIKTLRFAWTDGEMQQVLVAKALTDGSPSRILLG